MEEIPQNQEKPLIPFEESLKLAKELLEKYKQELTDIQIPDNMPEEERKSGGFGQSTIAHFLRKIPDDVQERFIGHGLFRGEPEVRLAAFINILQNSTMRGECAKLTNSGYYNAAKNVDFLILSHADKQLPVHLTEGTEEERRWPIKNEIGWLADPGAYVVDMKLYPLVEELRRMFPDKNILKSSELPDYITREIEASEKSQ